MTDIPIEAPHRYLLGAATSGVGITVLVPACIVGLDWERVVG
jgi:hypothetical protein